MRNRIHGTIIVSSIVSALWLFALIPLVSNHTQAAFTTDPDCTQEIGTWQAATNAPNAHIEGASAVVGDKLYMLTGFASYTDTLHPSNSTTIYEPSTDTWSTSNQTTPIQASHIQGASDGRYIWTVGGYIGSHPGTATTEVWRYDTQTDTWSAGPPLPEPRASGGAVVLGRELHYIGGLSNDRQTDQDDHYVLDLDNPVAWERVGTFPRARNHFQAVALEGKIYAVGGQFGHDYRPQDLAYLDVYDPTTNTWAPLADMPSSRSHAEMGTFAINERIIIVGGRTNEDGTDPVNTILEYNPQRDQWTQIGTLPRDRISPTANVVGDLLVVTNGGSNWYTPENETWVAQITNGCEAEPTETPTDEPTPELTETPTDDPTPELTDEPTEAPTDNPTVEPTDEPTVQPTEAPTDEPTVQPTDEPTEAPTDNPTVEPTDEPTVQPTDEPTEAPTDNPTVEPTDEPTVQPTEAVPTMVPTSQPIEIPGDGTALQRLAPVNNATMATEDQYVSRFQWRGNGAEWYRIFVSTPDYETIYLDSWFAAVDVCDISGVCTVPDDLWLTQNGDFVWWMTYWSPEIGDEWENLWESSSFTIKMTIPETTTGLTPAGSLEAGNINTTLQWHHIYNALWYEVWVGPDDYSSTSYSMWLPVTEICGEETCTIAMQETLEPGEYEFWLRAWNPAGISNWQQMTSFTVQ